MPGYTKLTYSPGHNYYISGGTVQIRGDALNGLKFRISIAYGTSYAWRFIGNYKLDSEYKEFKRTSPPKFVSYIPAAPVYHEIVVEISHDPDDEINVQAALLTYAAGITTNVSSSTTTSTTSSTTTTTV